MGAFEIYNVYFPSHNTFLVIDTHAGTLKHNGIAEIKENKHSRYELLNVMFVPSDKVSKKRNLRKKKSGERRLSHGNKRRLIRAAKDAYEKGRSAKKKTKFVTTAQLINHPKTINKMQEGLKPGVTLYHHQEQAIEWMCDRETRNSDIQGGILADEMGVGKTLSLLGLLLSRFSVDLTHEYKANLVIVPLVVLQQWKTEQIGNFIDTEKLGIRVLVYHGKNRQEKFQDFAPLRSNDIVLSTFQTITSESPFSNSARSCASKHKSPMFGTNCNKWLRVILDEGHEIRNAHTKKCKAIMKLQKLYGWVMTGTPIQNRMEDFIMYLYFMGLNRTQNLKRRLSLKPQETAFKLNEYAQTYVLRRTKQEIPALKARLAPKIIQTRWLEFSGHERAHYDRLFDSVKTEAEFYLRSDGQQNNHFKILSLIHKLRRCCCHPYLAVKGAEQRAKMFQDPNLQISTKIAQLLKDVKVIPQEDKCVIFSQWNEMLDLVELFMDRDPQLGSVKRVRLDGNTTQPNRGIALKYFQTDSRVRVFLVNLHAGGVGLNLMAANHVFLMDPWWNKAAADQAMDRVHRIDQSKQVHVTKYSIKDSIESNVYELQKRKAEHEMAVMSKDTGLISSLKLDEIKLLFKVRKSGGGNAMMTDANIDFKFIK